MRTGWWRPFTTTGSRSAADDPLGQLEAVGAGEQLAGAGEVAEAGGEVDRPADVVVALEEQHVAAGDAAAQRQVALAGVAQLDGHGRAHEGVGLDADDHHAVAEPLLDPDAEERGDLPHDRAQDLQLVHGGFVAVVVGEVGEPAEVDEGERAPDTPVDGDGGELGGVHDPHWTPCSPRPPPICDRIHMNVA